MVELTKEEKKLIEHSKKEVLRLSQIRRKNGFHDSILAFVLSDSGKIYSGCAFESLIGCANICAERTAIAEMCKQESPKARVVAVLATGAVPDRNSDVIFPCGTCRQAIFEFSKENIPIICTNFIRLEKGWQVFAKVEKYTLNQLYTHPFVEQWD